VLPPGFLTAENRIGVVVEGCPHSERAYEAALVPAADEAGLTIAEHVVTS
jgi:hypothetical protein